MEKWCKKIYSIWCLLSMKYLRMFWVFLRASIVKEIAFRANFFIGIIGSFCFIALYILVLVFLTKFMSFGSWGTREMWVLMGVFLIIVYAVFFLFWRGLFRVSQEIHSGAFDYILVLPVDSQFVASCRGGGVHNLLSLIFGIIILVIATSTLEFSPNILQIIVSVICISIAILDFYSLLILTICLGFKYGDASEIFWMTFRFQDFLRFPLEAFSQVNPFFLAIVIPFSALSSIPAGILIWQDYPVINSIVFILVSILFIIVTRMAWNKSLQYYSSASS